MTTLPGGLESIEINATAARVICNNNFTILDQGRWSSGLDASKPAAGVGAGTVSPFHLISDRYYYATDTGNIYWDDGATWIQIVAGSTVALNIDAGLLSARPAAGNAGNIYLATDTFTIYRDDGTNWIPYNGALSPWVNYVDPFAISSTSTPASPTIQIPIYSTGWYAGGSGTERLLSKELHAARVRFDSNVGATGTTTVVLSNHTDTGNPSYQSLTCSAGSGVTESSITVGDIAFTNSDTAGLDKLVVSISAAGGHSGLHIELME